ncbi:MAG: TlpA family protein disulfide reductase [Burkholderiales bacterium]|nr:TlpA family protein disulfide reductase [Burkholderiales bacterium]
MSLRRRAFVGSSAGALLAMAGCSEQRAADTRPRWPTLNARDLIGQSITLAATSEQPRIINFWALWCPPCRFELPSLERLAHHLAPRGVHVSTVALADDDFPVREYLLQHAKTLPSVLIGPRTPDAQQLGLKMLPQTFVVSPGGTVLAGWVGAREWDAPDVRQDIVRVLQAG